MAVNGSIQITENAMPTGLEAFRIVITGAVDMRLVRTMPLMICLQNARQNNAEYCAQYQFHILFKLFTTIYTTI